MAGSIARLPFTDATFNFVVASEVLEHLTDIERRPGIAEVHRVLKTNGWFLGTVPYRENLIDNYVFCPHCGNAFHRWGHQSAFDLDSLRRELSASLTVVELRRMAFVRFWERPLTGKIKSLARLVLAKYGCAIAVPSIYFAAQKRA